MRVRRFIIRSLRSAALSVTVALLLAASTAGALASPSLAGTGVEKEAELRDVQAVDSPRPRPPLQRGKWSERAVDSFRVQLYAATERGEAEGFRAKVRQWWSRVKPKAPSDVFGPSPSLRIEHAEPYYRVHLGAFSAQDRAYRAQSFLQRQYPNAFVTRAGEDLEGREPKISDDQTAEAVAAEKRNAPTRSQKAVAGQDTASGARLSPTASWNRIREAVQLVQRVSRDSVYTQAALAELFDVGCDPARPEQVRADALARESSHFDQNLGLNFEARYGQRTRAVVDETTGGLSGTYVGLEWDLLSQGLLGNRRRSTLLDARARTERLSGRLAQIQRIETCRARRIQERLRGMVPRLLETKITLSEDRQRLLRRAYLEGETQLDTFLEAKKETEDAKRRLKVLREKVHDEYVPDPLNAFPPLLNLDFQALAQARTGDSLRKELGEKERRVVALKDKERFDTRLSVFSRYTASRTLNGRDFEFGVRFSQPLFGLFSGKDGRAEAERTEARRREETRALSEQRENLRTVYRRFEEDQGRAIRAHYRVVGRRERVRQRLGQRTLGQSVQLNKGLRDAENLIGAAIEKALAYGEVYEEVARAFSAAREPFDPTYLKTDSPKSYERRGRAGRRALYMWSDEFQRRSNDFIIELARARKIERLVVTAGQNTPMEKVRALQARARKNDIATELLLAANHWARPGGVERARTRIENLDLHGSALHLDVEPHTFDDFDQRKEKLLGRYLKVLRATRSIIGDRKLMVSVPLFWPDHVYQEIAKIVDRVYLMAYGEKETRQRASQTLEAARFFSPDQRVVALRPEDFADPWALDRAISTLQEVVEADRFALHDLESFLQFIEDNS